MSIQPHEPQYQFPTSLPAQPSGLTDADFERIESDFEQHQAFWKRKAVLAFVVAPLVVCAGAKFVAVGISANIAAVCFGVAFVGWVFRPATPRGTSQHYAETPDMWPATESRNTVGETTQIIIINNVTINR